MKRRVFLGMAILSVVFCMWVVTHKFRSEAKEQTYAIDVTVQNVYEEAHVSEHVFGATVRSVHEAVVGARVSGIVTNMTVMEGDRVRKGQVLALIDAKEYDAQYKQSMIALNMAEEEEKYARRSWDDLKPEQRAQYKMESERLRAIVAESGAYMEKKQIVAPFDGVVSRKFVTDGTTVVSGTAVIRVVGDLTQKEVIFDVPFEQGEAISVGNVVHIRFDDVTEDATVVAIDPVANERTRKLAVHAQLSTTSKVHVGAFVDVVVLSGERHAGMMVPLSAIVRMYDDQFVFVVSDDGHAKMRKVDVLFTSDDRAIVRAEESGIHIGDRVVVYGAHNLVDGDMVHVVSF